MKKIILLFGFAICFCSFKISEPIFIGQIIYKFSFTSLSGSDLGKKLIPFLGEKQYYFIDSKNYKSLNENKDWTQLYNSETNTYYVFKKNKTANKFDGTTNTTEKYSVKNLNETETVAGFFCKSIQVETDNTTIKYFYNETINADKKAFAKQNFGEWNKYLEATNGALPLKFIITDHKNGFVWTGVATEVTRLDLQPNDFTYPTDFRLVN